MFGLIKNDCIASVIIGAISGDQLPLKLGTLIKIIPDYKGDGCLFQIRDFNYSLNIYKTAIYKCETYDFIPLTGEMYLYLLAIKHDEDRIHFIERVNSNQFNLNMLKMGCTILIRRPADANVKYYEFEVAYKGIVKSGTGCYIGLRLKSEYLRLPSDLVYLSQDYNFGGTGIVVPVDWILQNVYKVNDYQQEPSKSIKNTVELEYMDLPVKTICADLNIPKSFKPKLSLKELMDAMSQSSKNSRGEINKPSNQTVDNNVNGSAKNNEKTKCDLSDVEIKDCIDYNKSLENQITKYKATKRTDNESNNGNRNQIENIPEPCEENTPNEKINTNTNEIVTTEIIEHTTFCGKCKKKLIPISKSITLEKCKHTICYDCITPINMLQTSKAQYTQCPICPKQLNGDEVAKITGSDMLKLILDNPANKPHDGNIFELCFCRPMVKNCGIILNCKHKFCRTFLIGTLKEQLQRMNRSFCPLCCDEINDCQKNRLAEQMNLGVVKICRTCTNRADMRLVICQHPFCRKCIHDIITNQMLDPSKVTINCVTCQARIADSDITQYGSEELLAQFKLKDACVPVSLKSVDNTTPKHCQCVSCNNWILNRHSITLAGCNHCFCLNCFKKSTGRSSNSQIPTCPLCSKLEEFELESIMEKSVDVYEGNQILVECLICEQQFYEGLSCLICTNVVCFGCVKSTVLAQISNHQSPKCPFCLENLDLPIDFMKNNTPTVKLPDNRCYDLQSSLNIFEQIEICCLCSEVCTLKIILKNCGHGFCQQCLDNNFPQLLRPNKTVLWKCPVCNQPIDPDHIKPYKNLL